MDALSTLTLLELVVLAGGSFLSFVFMIENWR